MKSNEGWSSQLWSQFLQLRKEAWKKYRTSTGFEPVTSRYRCDALPTELWSHWRWEQVNCGFQASLRNCKNCDHNCEDRSSFDFISAVHIWSHNLPAPNVSVFIAQLVEHRIGIARSRVQAPLKSWIFFQASLRNCKNCDHNCEDHSSFDFTYWNILALPLWDELGFLPFSHPHLLRMILRVRCAISLLCPSCDVMQSNFNLQVSLV